MSSSSPDVNDESQSPLHRALALRKTPSDSSKSDDTFTNVHPLWHPVWGRGVFGGVIVAQSLAAAQETLSDTFLVHSMHCHFLLAANSALPVLYRVERLRDGRSVATRRVQAEQAGKAVFTTLVSFMKAGPDRGAAIVHQVAMPAEAKRFGPPTMTGEEAPAGVLSAAGQTANNSMYESVRLPLDRHSQLPEKQRVMSWVRVPRASSSRRAVEANRNSNLVALAYISDAYFIGTVARVHQAKRFNNKRVTDKTIAGLKQAGVSQYDVVKGFQDLADEEAEDCQRTSRPAGQSASANVEMMVSMDHTVYFHNQRHVRADEWMLSEMDTPWSGDERGLVMQRIWTKEGVLIATCIQEGMIRSSPGTPESKI